MRTTKNEKKPGRGFERKKGLVRYEGYIPDRDRFKTLQIRIGGWVKTNPDFNQHDYNSVVSKTKHKIKAMIRDWARAQYYFRQESIVDVQTSNVESGQSKRPYQYFSVDVVLYVINDLEYDRYGIEVITENMVENVLEVLDHFPEAWTFVKSQKNTKKKQCQL